MSDPISSNTISLPHRMGASKPLADVTDDAQSVADIFHDDDRMRALIKGAFDVLWDVSLPSGNVQEGTINLLRDASGELGFESGGFPSTISTAMWAQLIHPDDLQRVLHEKQDATNAGRHYCVEYRVRCQNDGYAWWEDRGAPVQFRNGKVVRWVGAARNITERKQAEADLHRTLDELQQLKAQLEFENVFLREEFARQREFEEIVGRSAAIQRVLEQVVLVAGTNSSVLITGETGTGKELVARAIHQRSLRRDRPLVIVNCAALPATLVESELFGHQKGAFTGAVSTRVGRFERANGGTIFLDEVGELPIDLQSKLLRVLQTGEFERIGSEEPRHVDVRVIAATNRDLEREVEKGSFRRDLYYRLGVFPIHVPALRQRKEDLPLLVAFLVEKKGRTLGRLVQRIPRDVMDQLTAYDWPGNVRELENVIERSIILSPGTALMLPTALHPTTETTNARANDSDSAELLSNASRQTLNDIERAYILRVCEACRWRIKGNDGAAERLGLHPSTLYFRMKKLHVTRPTSMPSEVQGMNRKR